MQKSFHYYSGSSKKTLYRIKYILRLSCARTLASKHKKSAKRKPKGSPESITSTENRLYIGWFGVLMIPTLLTATSYLLLPSLLLLQ
ncbi:hypothetical protein H5410_044423 [Solanum commersonii]|uniref:Domain X domain-containing protein n=1 Tax=Solanum commersonii TaxID=4109 RepID=A0A9J5X901_SOLCO|nr:hypothetical protein H5410_044423 [Solanum commersonii]